MGGRFNREGIYVYLRLIHVVVWQKPTQRCKTIILQPKIEKKKKPATLAISLLADKVPGTAMRTSLQRDVYHRDWTFR